MEKRLNLEEESCQQIFPNELWEKILGNVKPTDYFRIGSASSHFRALLKFQATKILFPIVAYIFFGLSTQQIQPYNFREITNLRKVCSSWRRTIDDLLQDLGRFSTAPILHLDGDNLPDKVVDRFEDTEDYEVFEEHFVDTHKFGQNPFLGQRVIFTFRYPRQYEPPHVAAFRACSELLGKYGHHIWYCGINQNMSRPGYREQFYKRLPKLLEKMPNIKDVELYELEGGCNFAWDTRVDGPFPELPKLRYLYLYGAPWPAVQQILIRIFQISHVNISGPQTSESVRAYMQLPNLEEVSVKLLGSSHGMSFRTFSEAEFRSIKVKKLRLNMVPLERDVTWNSTFRALHTNFSYNLEHLYLTLSRPYAGDGYLQRGLVLENLKELNLELLVPVPLTFLVPMSNTLTKITLLVWEGEESRSFELAKRTESIVKVYRFWRQLQNSNAWKIFQKLKLLTVSTIGGEKHSCIRNRWITDVKNKENAIKC